MDDNFSITNLTSRAPAVAGARLQVIKNKILGKKYVLSLVFTTPSHSKKLNEKYRQKNKVANILSFSIGKNEGEIFITLAALKNISLPAIFIHGLCHLKGMQHGSKMDSEEKKFQNLFKIKN